jgi:hypothetical protein
MAMARAEMDRDLDPVFIKACCGSLNRFFEAEIL